MKYTVLNDHALIQATDRLFHAVQKLNVLQKRGELIFQESHTSMNNLYQELIIWLQDQVHFAETNLLYIMEEIDINAIKRKQNEQEKTT